jgi:hypothetical protein
MGVPQARAKVLDHVLFEGSGRDELTLAFPVAALDDAWGASLVFQHMHLHSSTFDELTAE